MRLVCPNCVAQYEVADGTIPESGRDVQCANCGHIWFQDAAFKLSTDDLTYVPHRVRETTADDDADGDTPGMFHSQRAGRSTDAPAEPAERALPEVGDNVLDILRSEAAFSSRRRAEARAEQPASQPEQEPDHSAQHDAEDTRALLRRIGTRAADIAPPPETAEPAPEPAEPQAGDAIRASDADFKKAAWRHFAADRTEDAADDMADEGTDDEVAEAGFGSDAARKADDEGGAAADEPEYDEDPDVSLTGLPADEAKRIADATVARSAQAPTEPPVSAEERRDDVRKAIRRISVRSLAVPPADAVTEQTDEPRGAQPEPVGDEDRHADDAIDDEVGAFKEAVAAFEETDDEDAAVSDMEDSPGKADAEAGFGSYTETDIGDETAETGDEPKEDVAAPADVEDPDDIRHVRRSLAENRKVLLPDVEELNTSLRMDKPEAPVDLRATAFKDEDIANRNKFWLGLVTALMLFGIFSALYLMGPAISDLFPAADPYVTGYRDFVDTSLDATAKALVPLVDWLESL